MRKSNLVLDRTEGTEEEAADAPAPGRAPARDGIDDRVQGWWDQLTHAKARDLYCYGMTVDELLPDGRVVVAGKPMLMFASYSYLGLIGHPKIDGAATEAISRYGTGTHGVRLLAGTLPVHRELERAIARFKGTEDALTFSSGYATNLAAITALLTRRDVVICDSLDHASIVDGAVLSRSTFWRFQHNDLGGLERRLQRAGDRGKLVVTDAVFSMDGDVADLPGIVDLCRRHGARLMVDEAHSLGVLGKTGRGVEEHFGMAAGIDIKMGTLSKTIPSAGGYLAGSAKLINMYRHHSRPYIFSAAITPAQAAAATAALQVIEEEPHRVAKVQHNAARLVSGLKAMGLNTLRSETPIVPMICGSQERAYAAARHCHRRGLFVLPVTHPAVPEGLSRLRLTTSALHGDEDIDEALGILESAARAVGLS